MISEINKNKIKIDFSINVNFTIVSAGVQVRKGAKVVNSLIELLNSIQDDFVVGLDEVQELSQANRQFLDVLGNVFSSNRKVRFLFTGSYTGITKTLIEPPSSSPLHGRPPTILNLRPFIEDLSRQFLKKGMEELNLSFNKEEEVVRRLDGIVGWLTLFGNFYGVRKMSFEEALNSTIGEGRKIAEEEFKHFLEKRSNRMLYVKLMDLIKVVNRWSDIKRGVEISVGGVDDKELSLALDALVRNNFVEKVEKGEYRITDPLLREIDYGKISS
jgi:hypothetical protein